MIVAIDGPAASGKGTLARRLARHYGLAYLDTGSLYRAVGLSLLSRGIDPADEAAAIKAAEDLDPMILESRELRGSEVERAASVVAAMPAVRRAILGRQREIADTPPGAILDGRDIGTVVCPDADAKLFVTADLPARARRRYLELTQQGVETDEASVLADLEDRDRRDRERQSAPLRQAQDAVLLDTTKLDIEAAFNAAVEIIDSQMKRRRVGKKPPARLSPYC